MGYAQNTSVSFGRSKAEIEDLLLRYGATGFASGWHGDNATIMFQLEGRTIKFILPLPKREEFATKFDGRMKCKVTQSAEKALADWEQACRARWRALLLCIKAKLEACTTEITTLEHKFLAHFVQRDGRTLGDKLIPQLDHALEGASMKLIGM